MKLLYDRYSCTEDGKIYDNKTKMFLKPFKKYNSIKNTYLKVIIFVGNEKKIRSVHRLVYEFFYGEIPKGLQVNHKNGIKSDNFKNNLEIMLPKDNVKHAINTGLFIPNRGSKRIPVLNLDTGEVFSSLVKGSKSVGLHDKALSDYFTSKGITCGGYRWKKLED